MGVTDVTVRSVGPTARVRSPRNASRGQAFGSPAALGDLRLSRPDHIEQVGRLSPVTSAVPGGNDAQRPWSRSSASRSGSQAREGREISQLGQGLHRGSEVRGLYRVREETSNVPLSISNSSTSSIARMVAPLGAASKSPISPNESPRSSVFSTCTSPVSGCSSSTATRPQPDDVEGVRAISLPEDRLRPVGCLEGQPCRPGRSGSRRAGRRRRAARRSSRRLQRATSTQRGTRWIERRRGYDGTSERISWKKTADRRTREEHGEEHEQDPRSDPAVPKRGDQAPEDLLPEEVGGVEAEDREGDPDGGVEAPDRPPAESTAPASTACATDRAGRTRSTGVAGPAPGRVRKIQYPSSSSSGIRFRKITK